MDLIFAEYSVGSSIDRLRCLLTDAFDTATVMTQTDYETIFNLLSLNIILGKNDKSDIFVKNNENLISKDRLLSCFSSYIKKEEVSWDGDFILPDVYGGLNDLDNIDNPSVVMVNYLNSWYSKHRDCS